MDKSAIVKLGDIRNIIDQSHIHVIIESVIENKELKNYPHIQKWLKSNVKNYLIQQHPLKEIMDINEFPQIVQELISRKNIQSPYHEVDIDSKFIDKLNHVIDYLKSDFPVEKDLSRISFEQSKINADNWLKNRLKKLNGEEDPEFVIPILEFIDDNKKYRWVNLRSHKALKRESFMMNHCIETYWEGKYKEKHNTNERTDFYSLRDENNKSIITIRAYINTNNNIMYISEIKEKNNQFLSHHHRIFTDLLFKNQNFNNGLLLEFNGAESENSKYFLAHTSDELISGFYSINEIVEKQMNALNNRPIDFEEIKEYYSINDVIQLFKFKYLNINEDVNANVIYANKISLNNLNGKEISIESSTIEINNVKNTTININGARKPSVYLENSHHLDIIHYHVDTVGIAQKEIFSADYICKNSSHIHVDGLERIPDIKTVELNCDNITFAENKAYKNRCVRRVLLNQNKVRFDLSEYCYQLAGHSLGKAYDVAIKQCFPMYFNYLIEHKATKENNIYLNVLKKLDFTFEINTDTRQESVLKINLEKINEPKKILADLLLEPIETTKKLINEIGIKNLIIDKVSYLDENLNNIIYYGHLENFKEFKDLIIEIYHNVEKVLEVGRPIYQDILKNDDDNSFAEYLKSMLMEQHKYKKIFSYGLWITMFKNDMLKMTIEAKKTNSLENISYRFNFNENKIKSFFTRRIASFIGRGDAEYLYKELLEEPFFDNQTILNKIENIGKKFKP